ncbi:hypothetical protein ABT234_39815 [Streptomyces sp. NPDC001586]|uniref:hypothetical protein n=1 Tax=unclassified Streptomyces TaxID=2593676 RepID=UPI003319B64C
MALVFVGIDPSTGDKQSPTVWADLEQGELVLQGWKSSPEVEAECAATEVPGHAKGIPEGEAVIRVPARMVHIIREVCDDLDAHLR